MTEAEQAEAVVCGLDDWQAGDEAIIVRTPGSGSTWGRVTLIRREPASRLYPRADMWLTEYKPTSCPKFCLVYESDLRRPHD